LRNLRPIFLVLLTTVADYIDWRDNRDVTACPKCIENFLYTLPRVIACNVCYASVNYSFVEQRSVNTSCIEQCHLCPWLEVGHWTLNVGGTVGFS